MPACILMRDKKNGYGFGWVGKWGGLGRSEGGEIMSRIYYMNKTLFSLER